MKDFYISDAARFENQVITTSFVVVSKQAKPKKSGELYLALTLADRTGHLDAKMWDNVADHINVFEQDDFVKIRGLLNKFNGRFQLTVHKVRSMQESEVDFNDYLPRTTKDIGELWKTLADFVESFKDPHLKALLRAFMADPKIEQAYKSAPAAKTLHHAFIGGLLDHVVSLFRLCDLTCRNYPETINRDLLLTGAFLHDIGKIHELTFARSFTYTTRGQLLGHMIIELEMLHEKIAQVPGNFFVQHFQLDDHVSQKLAARGVCKGTRKGEFMDLADVMEKSAGQKQVAIDGLRIITACQVTELEEENHVVKQPADEGMVQRLGCRRILVRVFNLGIGHESAQQGL